ncbi:Hypothetical predicted protein [Pelobates cultripes]|uniref:Uncharacterized protein n=1 Tax=Pelobates cultripes TaxID=61616 RepID=A0AAD1RIV9_PELCU|nr:Hypothetical predicted protein [Pelobates cultripes]
MCMQEGRTPNRHRPPEELTMWQSLMPSMTPLMGLPITSSATGKTPNLATTTFFTWKWMGDNPSGTPGDQTEDRECGDALDPVFPQTGNRPWICDGCKGLRDRRTYTVREAVMSSGVS